MISHKDVTWLVPLGILFIACMYIMFRDERKHWPTLDKYLTEKERLEKEQADWKPNTWKR